MRCPPQPTRWQELGACPWPVPPEEENVDIYDLLLAEPNPETKKPKKRKVRLVKR